MFDIFVILLSIIVIAIGVLLVILMGHTGEVLSE